MPPIRVEFDFKDSPEKSGRKTIPTDRGDRRTYFDTFSSDTNQGDGAYVIELNAADDGGTVTRFGADQIGPVQFRGDGKWIRRMTPREAEEVIAVPKDGEICLENVRTKLGETTVRVVHISPDNIA